VNGSGDSLDFRRLRNVASYLAGIGAEVLLSLVLAGIAAAVVGAFLLTGR
jgi:hypothetical protein